MAAQPEKLRPPTPQDVRMQTPSDMTGKAALVTGAAGGLGRATALKLAGVGADIYAVDINAAALDETLGDLRALGVRAEGRATDLGVRENCQAGGAAAGEGVGR